MSTHNPRRRYDGNSFVLPRHIFEFSHRIIVVAAVSIVSLLLSGLLLYVVYAQTSSREQDANNTGNVSSGTVHLSGSGQAAEVAIPPRKAPMLEVHIANNGLMLLRGARVISTSDNTIRVGMAWGLADFTWTVNKNSGTKFFTSKGEKGTSAEIRVGDIVTVTGMLVESGIEPTIDATFVSE
ncbi:hypothetical protein C4556_00350 [Candidatus Parcubacteria bacterium]|nr:MAG: hypothetical protein C4556_00350 [Candidatus Parcubacteria bacterium]